MPIRTVCHALYLLFGHRAVCLKGFQKWKGSLSYSQPQAPWFLPFLCALEVHAHTDTTCVSLLPRQQFPRSLQAGNKLYTCLLPENNNPCTSSGYRFRVQRFSGSVGRFFFCSNHVWDHNWEDSDGGDWHCLERLHSHVWPVLRVETNKQKGWPRSHEWRLRFWDDTSAVGFPPGRHEVSTLNWLPSPETRPRGVTHITSSCENQDSVQQREGVCEP